MGIDGLKVEEFAAYGLRVSARPVQTMTVEEIGANPLGRLIDFQGFTFAAFPDQMLDAVREEENYEMFGTAAAGPFHGAFALDRDGHVRFLVDAREVAEADAEEIGELDGGIVNRSLEQFVSVFCLFISAHFRARAYPSTAAAVMEAAAREFVELAEQVEAGCTGPGRFWEQLAYELEDGMAHLARPLSDYIEAGRI
ncbi:hypothetical protein ACE6ED_10450 [Paenibacillus sp. CN-4]|uniref:hypothetical protein n=1 Tax=Paenibacillus nanchangensis TaxID=3348343 RepID=UPI00397BB474